MSYTDEYDTTHTVARTDDGYREAAILADNIVTIFDPEKYDNGEHNGPPEIRSLDSGRYFGFYMVQDDSVAAARDPDSDGLPNVWFSVYEANADGEYEHFDEVTSEDPLVDGVNYYTEGVTTYKVEDLSNLSMVTGESQLPNSGGYTFNDFDHNDAIFSFADIMMDVPLQGHLLFEADISLASFGYNGYAYYPEEPLLTMAVSAAEIASDAPSDDEVLSAVMSFFNTSDAAKTLLEETEAAVNAVTDGELTIIVADGLFAGSQAQWDITTSTIRLSRTLAGGNFGDQYEAAFISALVHELSNARKSADYQVLDTLAIRGEVTREEYATRKETIEYHVLIDMTNLIKAETSGDDPAWDVAVQQGYPVAQMLGFETQTGAEMTVTQFLQFMDQPTNGGPSHTDRYRDDYDRLQN